MKIKLALFIGIALVVSGVSSLYAQEVLEETAQETIPSAAITASAYADPGSVDIQNQESENIIQEELETESFIIESETDETNQFIFDTVIGTTTTATSTFNITDILVDGNPISPETQITSTSTVGVLIRNGADLVFEGDIEFVEGEFINVVDIVGITHAIRSDSALATLVKADQSSEDFEITKIKFFSFGGYLSCLSIKGEEFCENWQYRLNGLSPWDSIDTSIVKVGDDLGLYFGKSYQIVFDTNTYTTNIPFVARAEQYNYKTDKWTPRTDVILRVSRSDFFGEGSMPTPVNLQGESTFSIATSGEYIIGIQESYMYDGVQYFYYDPFSTIIVSSSTSTTTATTTPGSSTGGSSGGSSNKNEFDVSAAISFIKTLQNSNGSYIDERHSDWVAIAFASYGENDSALLSYLKSKAKIKSSTIENERRAMAILALNKNPYNFEGINYIDAIIKDFDGTQFGELNAINDDIFALIVLSKAGYDSNDVEIQKTIEFILKNKSQWANDIDLTSAAIQALNPYSDASGVSSALSKAREFLKKNQQADGGWGNVYATAWATQAMYELGENWSVGSNSPETYFTKTQQTDGGILENTQSTENRLWATRDAIPAVLGMSWNDILSSVSKPKNKGASSSDTNDSNTSTTTRDSEEAADEEIIAPAPVVEIIPSEMIYANNAADANVPLTTKTVESVQDINTPEESPIQKSEVEALANIANVTDSKMSIWNIVGGLFILGGAGLILGRRFFV